MLPPVYISTVTEPNEAHGNGSSSSINDYHVKEQATVTGILIRQMLDTRSIHRFGGVLCAECVVTVQE